MVERVNVKIIGILFHAGIVILPCTVFHSDDSRHDARRLIESLYRFFQFFLILDDTQFILDHILRALVPVLKIRQFLRDINRLADSIDQC